MSDRPKLEDDLNPAGQGARSTITKPPSLMVLEEPAEPVAAGPTPEEAAATSRRAVEEAQRARTAAEQQAQQATAEVQRLRESQTGDQVAVLSAAVEASRASRDGLADRWQAAMEAGDWKVAADLNKELATQAARFDRATGDLAQLQERIKQQPKQTQQAPGDAVPNRSQQWINTHPEFNTHKDALILRHQELLADGVTVESPMYFRLLEEEYGRLTGGGGKQQTRQEPAVRQQQFDGGAPSRGGGSGASGRTIKTALGDIVVRRSNGQDFMSIPNPQHRAEMEEGAKVSRMPFDEYVWEQVKAHREMEAGGTGGMIVTEGRTYR